MDATRLEAEKRAYMALRNWLVEQHNLDPDDASIAGTLEGVTSFHETIAELVREAARREGFANALQAIIGENRERKNRHENAAAGIRARIAQAMIDADLKKVEAPDATISVRIGATGVKVVSEELLPEEAVREKILRVTDMAWIKNEIAEGRQVPGVVKTNGAPILTIRNR